MDAQDQSLIVSALLFTLATPVCAAGAAWVVGSFRTGDEMLRAERARRGLGPAQVRALGGMFAFLGAPFTGAHRFLARRLVLAGRPYGDLSGARYLGFMIACALIGGAVVALAAVTLLTIDGQPASILISRGGACFVFGALIGLAASYSDLAGKVSQTSARISLEFPFYLDLALLVVQAGGTPREAIATYIDSNPGTPLSNELQVALKDADTSSLDEALRRMADRVDPESVRLVLRNLAQSERTTGKVADFYAQQGEELRFLRSQLAERARERLKANLAVPNVMMTMAIGLALMAGSVSSMIGMLGG